MNIPLIVIKTYRLIPNNIRGKWSFGTSSSHLALETPTWTSLFHYATPKLDTYRTGWPEGTPGSSLSLMNMNVMNAYANGWPDMMVAQVNFWRTFKTFVVGWFRLALLLPLVILGVGADAPKPNWEVTPPSR